MRLITKYKEGGSNLPKKTIEDLDIYSAEIQHPVFGNPDTIIWAKRNNYDYAPYRYSINGNNTTMGGLYPGQHHIINDDDKDTIDRLRKLVQSGLIKTANTNTWERELLQKYLKPYLHI